MSEQRHEKYISDADMDRLIAAHDGNMALLFIYRLRTGISDTERTAQDLCMTVREVGEADEKLRRLIQNVPTPRPFVPEPSDEIPEYKSEDIVRRSSEDEAFSAILTEAGKVMGKPLSSPDMKLLFGIYDNLGIPSEVMLMLINYCGMVFENKYHGQRRPTIRTLQKEAVSWVNQEIMTVESAEQHIEKQIMRGTQIGKIKELLGIRGRELVKSELEKINSWLDMGFGEETISIAFERTVTNTGALKWNYMDSIIRSWNEKKLFTPEEIEEKDSKRPPVSRSAGGDISRYFSGLDDVLNKI